jgi:hypothetical protein
MYKKILVTVKDDKILQINPVDQSGRLSDNDINIIDFKLSSSLKMENGKIYTIKPGEFSISGNSVVINNFTEGETDDSMDFARKYEFLNYVEVFNQEGKKNEGLFIICGKNDIFYLGGSGTILVSNNQYYGPHGEDMGIHNYPKENGVYLLDNIVVNSGFDYFEIDGKFTRATLDDFKKFDENDIKERVFEHIFERYEEDETGISFEKFCEGLNISVDMFPEDYLDKANNNCFKI